MKYISTRNKSIKVSSAQAIVSGLAKDGGLFVPEEFPKLTKQDFDELIEMSYPERVAKVLSLYLDDYSYDELLRHSRLIQDFMGKTPVLLSISTRDFTCWNCGTDRRAPLRIWR